MKHKFLVPIFLSIAVGLFLGKVFFDNYNDNSTLVFNEKAKIYMLRITYKDKNAMKNSFKNYDSFLYKKEDNQYYLYVGITESKKNAALIKEYYEKQNFDIFVETKIIDNKQFISVLGEYDRIFEVVDNNDIGNIEKIVVANYKEMVLENET